MSEEKVILNSDDEFIGNPYKHFYKRHEQKLFDDNKVSRDGFERVPPNEEEIRKRIIEQIEVAKKDREIYISEAMAMDPAFMFDPIEDYYKKLIPKQLRAVLSEEEIMEIVEYYDPVTWAKNNLYVNYGGWEPRTSKNGFPYQGQMVRSISKRIVTRAGRRIGKSASLSVRIVHRAFTWKPTKEKGTYNIVIFTPNQSQVNVIFKMIEELIDGNDELLNMCGREAKSKRKVPTRKSPITSLELNNGVTITGYVSGSSAVRGSAADFLVLDEASFLTSEDTDAVIALINEHQDVELWVSSTPKGHKDYFYDRVHDKTFVGFYFPTDKFHPEWSLQMETDFRNQLTISGYNHEVLAAFSDDGDTVFQAQFVKAAQKDYAYAEQIEQPDWLYAMGVDWNDAENGTQIVIIGYNIKDKRYKVVDKSSVHIAGWTQTKAVADIVKLNNKWKCDFIYADYGHGSAQIERLHEIGLYSAPNSQSRKLIHAKSINYSSSIEVIDPWTKERVKKQTKSYMVNNAVRIFENEFIDISINDQLLIDQLSGYIIEKFTPSGVPVYGKDPKVGDHMLDAVMLGLFAFHMEYSSLIKPLMSHSATGLNIVNNSPLYGSSKHHATSPIDDMLERDKAMEREEYEIAHGISINQNMYKRGKSMIIRNTGTRSQMVNRNKSTRRKNI